MKGSFVSASFNTVREIIRDKNDIEENKQAIFLTVKQYESVILKFHQ